MLRCQHGNDTSIIAGFDVSHVFRRGFYHFRKDEQEGLMYAVISTDGQLDINQLEKECVRGKWIPLCVLRHRETNEIYLPIFNLNDICRRFAVRNLPKDWSKGSVLLTQEDYLSLDQKGWKFMLFDFPRVVNDDKDYELTFEIHEFLEQPDFMVS